MVKTYRCKNAMEVFAFVGAIPGFIGGSGGPIKVIATEETSNRIDTVSLEGEEDDLNAHLAQHLAKADWYTMEEI